MCGICGAVGVDGRVHLDAMADSLRHRGPDSCGVYRDGPVELASRRLSIIDPAGGDQPITNADGDVVVVYNGETYNFRALRTELRDLGYEFATGTDTEVFAHGYEAYGTDLFARLDGMFAVAIWDATAERLVLARDRFGIKPLSYARTDGGLLFGSEPKALLASGHCEPAVDPAAVRYFLQLRYSPSTTSLFAGVETLPPATYLVAEPAETGAGWSVSTHRYWRPTVDREPPANPASAVRTALRAAVERQLMSDVPVGFYLSGGLDTSSVVAMAAEASDGPISTFCMGFADASWDERDDARVVADEFGTDHHELTIDGSFVRDFPEMIWHADEPKRNLYPWYVAREMRSHVTVALGGLGADELFGGYVYRLARLRELDRLRSLPAATREALRTAAARLVDRQRRHGDLADDEFLDDVTPLARLDDPDALYVLTNSSDVVGDADVYDTRAFGRRLRAADDDPSPAERIRHRHPSPGIDADSLPERARRYDLAVKLPDDFLLVEDRMSMAHSLESRVPFLDNALVDVALSLPIEHLLDADESEVRAGKAVLREAMRDRLPPAVFEKDKQGFTMPTLPFVRDELLDHARCVLDDPAVVADGLVRESYLRDLLGRQPSASLVPHYKLLWKLVALEIWYQMYVVDGATGPAPIERYYS